MTHRSTKRLRRLEPNSFSLIPAPHEMDEPQVILTQRSALATVVVGDAGFTLLESLVSFAILAFFLTVIFSGISQTLRADRQADLSRRALIVARSKLDQLGILEPLIPGEISGTLDGVAWIVVVRPAGNNSSSPQAFWVSASASIVRTPPANPVSVTLTTLKLEGRSYGR